MPRQNRVSLRLGLLLRQAHRRTAGAVDDALAPLGLTGKHVGVLMIIDRDGYSTQRDLIRETGSDKAGMVRTVEDLEGRGYLSRTRSTTDRRVSELTLTAAGRAAFETAKRQAGAVVRDLVAPFTQAELDTLEALLTRFVDAGRQP